MAALKAFNIEAFTLLAIALLVTIMRCVIRVRTVGFKNLWADDYLVVVAAIAYGVETGLAYCVGNLAHGLANNSMTPAEREALDPNSQEVLGSKIQLAGWSTYSFLLWVLKTCMCTFYFRLTKDLDGYRPKIYFGFGFLLTSWLAVQLNIFLSCRPNFSMWWQINPDPGQFCYPAISPSIIWVGLAMNVSTDLYLIMIPMPMLFKAAMPLLQKCGLIALFSCGLFVTMAALLRVILLVSDPINGAQLAGSWAVRETFVAVVTTNIPMLFPTFKKAVAPIVSRVGSSLGFSQNSKSGGRSESKVSRITLDTWRRKSIRQGAIPLAGNHMSGEAQSEDGNATSLVDLTNMNNSKTAESGQAGYQRQVEVSAADAHKASKRTSQVFVQNGDYTSTWSDPNSHAARQGSNSEFYRSHVQQEGYHHVQ
ncbi:hypothetical protein BGZ63DRAFT_364253 [Mariannaea sp. PMI_226]|nr:hypothetical protein BGZ63DRAFT_364253 [Mariannaea sp. PMI_226]